MSCASILGIINYPLTLLTQQIYLASGGGTRPDYVEILAYTAVGAILRTRVAVPTDGAGNTVGLITSKARLASCANRVRRRSWLS